MRHGAFGWAELMTTDVNAAKRFYAELFGWQMEDSPMGGTNYVVLKVGDDPVGGLMALPPECQGMPPAWGVYVTVDDIDVTVAKVEGLGGKTLRPPTEIPQVGRFAVLQDPQGAVLCAMQHAQKHG